MTWSYKKSHEYWHKRWWSVEREGDAGIRHDEPFNVWLELHRHKLSLRADFSRKIANDSRLHADIRSHARREFTKLKNHLTDKCRPVDKWTGTQYECDRCSHEERMREIKERKNKR